MQTRKQLFNNKGDVQNLDSIEDKSPDLEGYIPLL
jgi:hypothetical protein